MAAGTCTICGCTDDRACTGGCEWIDEARERCSTCDLGGKLARVFLTAAAHVYPQIDPSEAALAALPAKHRQLLTMAARAIVEMVTELGQPEDVVILAAELRSLVAALEQRYPDVLAEAQAQQQPLADLVVGLIETGGRRVVLR